MIYGDDHYEPTYIAEKYALDFYKETYGFDLYKEFQDNLEFHRAFCIGMNYASRLTEIESAVNKRMADEGRDQSERWYTDPSDETIH